MGGFAISSFNDDLIQAYQEQASLYDANTCPIPNCDESNKHNLLLQLLALYVFYVSDF